MFKSGLFLSAVALSEAPTELLAQIYDLAGLPGIAHKAADPAELVAAAKIPADTHDGEDERAFEMDQTFARRFLEKCSAKTRKAISEAVRKGGSFEYDEIEGLVGMGSLRGVWTGITNRLRNLSQNPNAKMFEWVWDDEAGSWRGQMSPKTVEAFRASL